MSFFQSTKFIDETGVPYGIKHVNNKPRVSAMPYTYDIAEGNVSGRLPWFKLGFNPDVGAGVTEDVWTAGGQYVFPTAEQQMEVVSSSANDTSAGTGVRTARIHYLDSAGAEKNTTVTMNGTTPVATSVSDIYRVQNFRAATVGSGATAAGNIDVRNLSDTPIYSQIRAGYTRARNSMWTVPAGKVLYITNAFFAIGGDAVGKDALVSLLATYDDTIASTIPFFMPYFEMLLMDGNALGWTPLPARFPAGTDIKVRVSEIGTNNALVTATLVGWIEDA